MINSQKAIKRFAIKITSDEMHTPTHTIFNNLEAPYASLHANSVYKYHCISDQNIKPYIR